MQHLQPNTTLQGGKYTIERVLGQGGFGNTYVGINTTFNDRIAIKEFFMHGINDRDDVSGFVSVSLESNKPQFEEQLEKFKKEALRIRRLDSPHIVKVHDLFEENGTAYYVMDYVDGENLAEHLKRTGRPMTESEVMDLLPQILDALKTIHDSGIWHLDLKPANIMVDKTGKVKLIDFGASKQFNAQKGGATSNTAICYSRGYAPLEQMDQNYDMFGPWTDIYALGATLYNLLTNKRPPLPTDIYDDLTEDKHDTLPYPDSVSLEIRSFVLMMLNPSRYKRPQSVDFLKEYNFTNSDKQFELQNGDEETIVVSKQLSDDVSLSGVDESNLVDKTKNEVIDLNVDKKYDHRLTTLIKSEWKTIFLGFLISFVCFYMWSENSGDSMGDNDLGIIVIIYAIRILSLLAIWIIISFALIWGKLLYKKYVKWYDSNAQKL